MTTNEDTNLSETSDHAGSNYSLGGLSCTACNAPLFKRLSGGGRQRSRCDDCKRKVMLARKKITNRLTWEKRKSTP